MRIACIGVRAGALFGAVAFAVGVGSAAAPDGRWVAEHVRDRDQGRDARFDMRMRLVDSRGGVRERRFKLMLRKGAASEDRGLIRFTQPADIILIGSAGLLWHAHDRQISFMPVIVEERPCLRKGCRLERAARFS